MTRRIVLFIFCLIITILASCSKSRKHFPESSLGWKKYADNPVLGGEFGVIFDVCVMKDSGQYKMWCSWRSKKSIAYSVSNDGTHWSNPIAVLTANPLSGWEADVNRPSVIKKNGEYLLWYTGQVSNKDGTGQSRIGFAKSKDGIHWFRVRNKPVLAPGEGWEKSSVMCPDVKWDEGSKHYKMWYSAGEQFEPDAIGYADSKDGVNWKKHAANPIFKSDANSSWEKAKVTACDVIKYGDNYLMFYIGFEDDHIAHIGVAKSKNGIDGWIRSAHNPIISSGKGWDADAVYKPSVLFNGTDWLLWFNGRKDHIEQIGEAVHKGADLAF